jgi:metal-responsive CopG/Arc/MetJ family transcriptional regulator
MERKGFMLTLPSKDCEEIERLVKERKYKNRNDFVDKAVKKLIDEKIPFEMSEETIKMLKKALHIKCT